MHLKAPPAYVGRDSEMRATTRRHYLNSDVPAEFHAREAIRA
jgi:hypothetical protein